MAGRRHSEELREEEHDEGNGEVEEIGEVLESDSRRTLRMK